MPLHLIFATNNHNKVKEVKKLLGDSFEVSALKEAGINIDIPEPYDSLEENAYAKSSTIFKLTGKDCFSEDTGLFVDALDGEPGVKSARYSGEAASNTDNIQKLLAKLSGISQRNARFRTVISLLWNGKEHRFEGVCEGKIIHSPCGDQGFGYDAVFVPEGSDKSFAEMELEEKNKFSHRKKAMARLIHFLTHNNE